MHNILLTPGDGIGPEVMDATLRVLGWYRQERNFALPDRGSAWSAASPLKRLGRSDPDETIAKAKAADAVLLGAVGGPQWDNLPFPQKPERGLAAPAQGHGAVRQSAMSSPAWPPRPARRWPSWEPRTAPRRSRSCAVASRS